MPKVCGNAIIFDESECFAPEFDSSQDKKLCKNRERSRFFACISRLNDV
jgi:hypothetical protein